MPEFASLIELSTLDGTNGFRLEGTQPGEFGGRTVAGIGDINGDGFADIAVTAPLANGQRGASFVVFGKAAGFADTIDFSTLDGASGFRIDGLAAGDFSGTSIASAGDVNGDGFGDFIIGAAGAKGQTGESYVVFGKAGGFTSAFDLATLNGSNGFRIDAITTGDTSGYSVSTAGDVNGDGFDDIILSATRASAGGDPFAGQSYVIFGKASGFASSFNLSSLDGTNGFRLDGVNGFDQSGEDVGAAGDINGDGFADIVISHSRAAIGGNNYAGETYVVFGKSSGFASALDLASLDGKNGFRIEGIDAFDNAGASVSTAGDINGDGFDDLVIGVRGGDPGGQAEAGETYVVFGKAGGFSSSLSLSSINGSNGFRIDGVAAGDNSGVAVSNAGDVNGDGFDDLIIGATGANGAAGESYVVFGGASGFGSAIGLDGLDGSNGFRIAALAPQDSLGASVAAAGDVNHDGFADIIVSAPGAGSFAGQSFVIFGHRALTSVNRIGSDIAQTINGGVGDDTISGLDGNDRLIGWEGDDIMQGGSGGDTMGGGIGDDSLSGGSGNDRLRDGFGDNFADGGSGNDRIFTLSGDDTLIGGDGNDTLIGGLGDDEIRGGGGNDLILISGGNDAVAGGSGNDTLSFAPILASGVTADLATGFALAGSDTVSFSGIDNLNGTVRADHFTGDNLANALSGRAGNDTLSGGLGNDILNGGRNGDLLSGGGGNDVFDFNSLLDSRFVRGNRDVITDFDSNGDQINLATIDAVPGAGDDAFTFIGTAAFTDVGQVRVFQQGGNTFIDVNASGDTRADMRIELTGLISLDAADFIL